MENEYAVLKVNELIKQIRNNPPQWFIDNVKKELGLSMDDIELSSIITNVFEDSDVYSYDEDLELKYLNTELLDKVKELGIMGKEFDPGELESKEYLIIALSEDIYIDIMLEEDELVDTRSIYSFGYIQVKDNYTLDISGGILLTLDNVKELGYDSGKELYEALDPEMDMEEQMWKVGYDIEPGKYCVSEDDTGMGFVEIYNGPIGGSDDEDFEEVMEDDTAFDIEVGQYVHYYDGAFTKID